MKLTATEMSAFLMYRMPEPLQTHTIDQFFPNRTPISDSSALEHYLEKRVKAVAGPKTALALSGGIDSAILARFMPKGSVAYTFKCVVPGMQVTDETPAAASYAKACGLEHRVVEIYWEDFERYSDALMARKGAPIHSIEVQIYKAALQAKQDGIERLIFGEAADAVYGGQSNILSKDWRFGDFVDRFSYVKPYAALRDFELPVEAIRPYETDGIVDPYRFMSNIYIQESVASYLNPSALAELEFVLPYAETRLDTVLDYSRIRNGENKYLVREVFQRLYPGFSVPQKLPMPRPMNEWMRNWKGPARPEFWPHCTDGMTGDQKWLLWALERFLDLA